MKNIKFEYYIGDAVKIKDVNVKAKVDSCLVNANGLMYQCVYWFSGDRKSTWCYDWELEKIET